MEHTMIASEVERIWREFRKGCVDTQVEGNNPEDCVACLEAAVSCMSRVGLTNRDAALMVLNAKSFKVCDESKYSIFAVADITK